MNKKEWLEIASFGFLSLFLLAIFIPSFFIALITWEKIAIIVALISFLALVSFFVLFTSMVGYRREVLLLKGSKDKL